MDILTQIRLSFLIVFLAYILLGKVLLAHYNRLQMPKALKYTMVLAYFTILGLIVYVILSFLMLGINT